MLIDIELSHDCQEKASGRERKWRLNAKIEQRIAPIDQLRLIFSHREDRSSRGGRRLGIDGKEGHPHFVPDYIEAHEAIG